MFAFIVRRIAQALLVMFIISIVGFAIKHNVGDPVRMITGISTSEAEREALREEMGLKDPVLVQYGRFLKNALHGDLGTSYFYQRPATSVILEKAPATIELVLASR